MDASVMYETLRAFIEERGVEVDPRLPDANIHYRPALLRKDGSVAKKPQIIVHRLETNSTRVTVTKATCTLAHEYGHHLAYPDEPEVVRDVYIRQANEKDKTWWRTLPEKTKHALLHVEESAWEHARATLRVLRFTAWKTFNAERSRRVRGYRTGMWPTDAPATAS